MTHDLEVKLREFEKQMQELSKKVHAMEVNQARWDEKLSGIIAAQEKVTKRLDQVAWLIMAGIGAGVLNFILEGGLKLAG